jgi:hypothetical protein
MAKLTLPSMSLTGGEESWSPFVVVVAADVDSAAAPSLAGLERRKAARAEVRPMKWRRVV